MCSFGSSAQSEQRTRRALGAPRALSYLPGAPVLRASRTGDYRRRGYCTSLSKREQVPAGWVYFVFQFRSLVGQELRRHSSVSSLDLAHLVSPRTMKQPLLAGARPRDQLTFSLAPCLRARRPHCTGTLCHPVTLLSHTTFLSELTRTSATCIW